jgi:glycosyltransferase involved in cell wall biosynthesis
MVRRRGTKVVLLAHGSFWDDGVPRPVRLVWDWVERLVAGRADLILTNNREDRDDTVAAGNAPNRVKHMPGGLRGIDLHRYTRPTLTGDEKVRRRQELGLPGGTLVGVFGRVTPAKGLVDLCRAIVRLADVDVHLLFVGAARGERGGSRTLSAIQHLGPRATYWGWVDNPIPLMELCDIVVNPSLREGLGLVSVEAGALAVPVVATSTRGSRYAVLHEQTGLLVPPRDAAALALAIRRLASNPEEAHRMGQAGQSRNRELFDAHAVTTRVVAELSGVLAGHVRGHDAKTVAVDRGCRI